MTYAVLSYMRGTGCRGNLGGVLGEVHRLPSTEIASLRSQRQNRVAEFASLAMTVWIEVASSLTLLAMTQRQFNLYLPSQISERNNSDFRYDIPDRLAQPEPG